MAWGYRASSYANDGAGFTAITGNGGTVTITLGAALSSADCIVLGIACLGTFGSDSTPTFAVSDSVNGSWGSAEISTTTYASPGLGTARASLWVLPNSGAGTPVVTVTITGTFATDYFGGLQVAAFSGLATSTPKDTAIAATNTDGSPTSGAVSPATGAANELMVGCYLDHGYNTTLSVGNINGVAATLAGKHDADGGHWQGLLEYGDSGNSGGTPAATVTTTGTPQWAMIGAVLKLAGGGGGTTFTTSLVGATSPSGIVGKLAKKPALVGVTASAGALARAHGKVCSGASTCSGTIKRVGAKALSGITTPIGALVDRIIFHLTGLATSAGVLVPFHGQAQSLAGATTPTGTLQKVFIKHMAGSATSTGLLTGVAASSPGSFIMSPNTFSGTQARTIALFGSNTNWVEGVTTWTTTFSGANLANDSIVITGLTTATWFITPGSGVGFVTLSDGQRSAVLTVLATVSEFDELLPCTPATLDELAVCA